MKSDIRDENDSCLNVKSKLMKMELTGNSYKLFQ